MPGDVNHHRDMAVATGDAVPDTDGQCENEHDRHQHLPAVFD